MKLYNINGFTGNIYLVNANTTEYKTYINYFNKSYFKTFTLAKKELIKILTDRISRKQDEINNTVGILSKLVKLKKSDVTN